MLFLDEPTVGLDPRIRHELLDLIGRLRDRIEMTILLTTHYLDEAERLCDRIAIIHAGQIVALDTPRALLAGPRRSELVELRVNGDAGDRARRLRDARHRRRRRVHRRLHAHRSRCTTTTAPDAIAEIDGRARASPISTRQPTLDDVYLQLTGGRLADAA